MIYNYCTIKYKNASVPAERVNAERGITKSIVILAFGSHGAHILSGSSGPIIRLWKKTCNINRVLTSA